MNTRLVMSASAVVLAAAGIAGTFAPHELLRAMGVAPAGSVPLVVQLHAAALLGFAALNWTARQSVIGGIYNRAIALANLMHYLVGGLALLRGALWIAAIVYGAFAIAFGAMVFGRSPVARP